MADQSLSIYAAITDLLVAIQENRLRYKALSQPVQQEIAFHIEQADLSNKTIDISSLSVATNHSRNTIKKQLNALIEADYVSMIIDPNDSRRKILKPTQKLREELENFAKSLSPTITKASYQIQNTAWSTPVKKSK
ncbi:hypothetical protein [Sneathiella sp.]|jgi:DNA-binding MarR family transcriptional regulator|uniref:hypothetical protein n=1 Tax=Sneathiella sp. TaxID=1964365 RepID=UPI0039E6D3E8